MLLPVLTVRFSVCVFVILAVTANGQSTGIINIDDPVKNSTSFTLLFTWLNETCKPTYKINVLNASSNHFVPQGCHAQEGLIGQTTENQFFYGKASPDYKYKINIGAYCNDSLKANGNTSFSTTEGVSGHTDLSNVIPLLDKTNNKITAKVSWTVTCDTNGNINYFKILLYKQGTLVQTENTSDSTTYSYTISNLSPITTYSVYVVAVGSQDGEKGSNQTFTTGNTLPPKPNVTITNETSNSFVINWEDTPDYSEQIDNFSIIITTIGPNYDCPDCPINPVPNITESSNARSYNFTAEPAYRYIVRVAAINIDGESVSEAKYANTSSAIPGIPTFNLSETTVGSTYFYIAWNEPKNKSGDILSYHLTITPLGRQYDYYTFNCTVNETVVAETFNGSTFGYYFGNATPYSAYSLELYATTEAGDGSADVVNITTNTDTPEAPINLNITRIDNLNYNVSWVMPCNANGPTAYFDISVFGNYTEDNELTDSLNFTMPFKNDKYEYSATIQIRESFVYYVDVSIILDDNTTGLKGTTNFTTRPGIPGKPRFISINAPALNSTALISWEAPLEKMGKILDYEIKIVAIEPLYPTNSQICNMTKNITSFNNQTDQLHITVPLELYYYYNYSIAVRAKTSAGRGEFQEFFCSSVTGVPENAIVTGTQFDVAPTEIYNASITINFAPPCLLNGEFSYYRLNYSMGFDPTLLTVTNTSSPFNIPLVHPEITYTYSIETVTTSSSNKTDKSNFTSPSAAPEMRIPQNRLPMDEGDNEVRVHLEKEYFSGSNVMYIALILYEGHVSDLDSIEKFDPSIWPNITNQTLGIFQLTEDRWSPFANADSVTFTIGDGPDHCSFSQCNRPLKANTEYHLRVRAYTNSLYRNSRIMHFQTSNVKQVATIVGSIFGILVPACLGFLVFIIWRRKMIRLPGVLYIKSSSSTRHTPIINTSIPVKKFIQYTRFLENNPEKMKEQYMLLAEKSKELSVSKTTNYAHFPENKRKNRYTNILPFDETRVKLLIDEDDDLGSDYINASYIKGYTGQIEYIATQGPLETTCRDFWKMVIQENVSIIVMVSQFIENDKIKCYRYFPKNRESMYIEDIEVRCCNELHFGIYYIRMLQVRKDTVQVNVIHMQFLEWPDFGVPTGTEHMLQFCYQLRQRIKTEGGCIVIHCSAGVGRTGTLIATDILLQTVNAKKNIDVYNTVYELRKQRINMVQTEKQYIYIHSLVRDYIDRPPTPDLLEAANTTYENVSVLQDQSNDPKIINSKKKLTNKENESTF